jgi:hypothetical protein
MYKFFSYYGDYPLYNLTALAILLYRFIEFSEENGVSIFRAEMQNGMVFIESVLLRVGIKWSLLNKGISRYLYATCFSC